MRKGGEWKMNLKEIRENELNMSEEAFLKELGISKSVLEKYENDPSSIDVKTIIKIANLTGKTFSDLKASQKQGILKKNPEELLAVLKNSIIEYENNFNRLQYEERNYKKMISEYDELSNRLSKPIVAMNGALNEEKWNIISSLIDIHNVQSIVLFSKPISIYFRHTSEQPSFIKKEVTYFNNAFKINQISDEKYYNEWVEEDAINEHNRSAVVYLPSPFLKTAQLNFLVDEDVEQLKFGSIDVALFIDCMNQKIKEEEYSRFQKLYSKVTTSLKNIFIVLNTQIKTVDKENKDVVSAVKSCVENLSNIASTKKNNEIEERVFVYSRRDEKSIQNFESSLKSYVEQLKQMFQEKRSKLLNELVECNRSKLIQDLQSLSDIIKQKELYQLLAKNLLTYEAVRKEEFSEACEVIVDAIQKYKLDSVRNFKSEYEDVYSNNRIKSFLNARKALSHQVRLEEAKVETRYNIIQKIESNFIENSKKLSVDLESFIMRFSDICSEMGTGLNWKQSSFRPTDLFIREFEKYHLVNGITAFAHRNDEIQMVSPAIVSKLKKHLNKKFVFPIELLSPVEPTNMFVYLFKKTFQKSWETKVVEHLEFSSNTNNIVAEIEQYWDDTQFVFEQIADQLENEWNQYIEDRNEKINVYSIDELDDFEHMLKKILYYFNGKSQS